MNNYTTHALKPLPYALAGDGRKIKYRCRRCGADFSYYTTEEKHCHVCGGEVDWDVPAECSDEFRRKYNIIINEPLGAARTTKLTNLFFKEFSRKIGTINDSQNSK